jgi:acetolactate synthase-1/2/3 large subunit
MSRCLAAPGVHLIEVPVDYVDNDRILNHQIKQQSAQI